ncbi:MAG: DUF2461 domain-containing protein [bacterium]
MSQQGFKSFRPALTQFLNELAENNNREWFQQNRERYESEVVGPVLDFIRVMQPRLMEISPYLMAEAKKVGGSMFRIYRDTRFSKDKTPYKTHVGIRFPHREFKQHAGPGVYLHLSPKEVYLAAGVWHPETSALTKIRMSIDQNPETWLKTRDQKEFRELFELSGDSLNGPPRGYQKDHPMIEDLKRKDFVGVQRLAATTLLKEGLPDKVARSYRAAGPFLHFLAKALDVPF